MVLLYVLLVRGLASQIAQVEGLASAWPRVRSSEFAILVVGTVLTRRKVHWWTQVCATKLALARAQTICEFTSSLLQSKLRICCSRSKQLLSEFDVYSGSTMMRSKRELCCTWLFSSILYIYILLICMVVSTGYRTAVRRVPCGSTSRICIVQQLMYSIGRAFSMNMKIRIHEFDCVRHYDSNVEHNRNFFFSGRIRN